jgi:hypothetical protein
MLLPPGSINHQPITAALQCSHRPPDLHGRCGYEGSPALLNAEPPSLAASCAADPHERRDRRPAFCSAPPAGARTGALRSCNQWFGRTTPYEVGLCHEFRYKCRILPTIVARLAHDLWHRAGFLLLYQSARGRLSWHPTFPTPPRR